MVEDRHLRPVLQDAIRRSEKITYLTQTKIIDQRVDERGITVTCDDQTTYGAKLLIGADGRQSETATRAGIRRTGWRYEQTALVCAIEHERPTMGLPINISCLRVPWPFCHCVKIDVRSSGQKHQKMPLRSCLWVMQII